jgi:nucleoside phosphorylase
LYPSISVLFLHVASFRGGNFVPSWRGGSSSQNQSHKMYLLHLQIDNGVASPSLQLTQYIGDIPPYAILSHRWGAAADEVTFQDLMGGATTARQKKGYRKIEACYVQAMKDGLSHAWIDTCCIDKTSSAELSEAINSMYEWYRSAQVCYAYLEDVLAAEDPHKQDSSFRRSSWFTRGWTLQELIAPTTVNFFAGDWTQVGDKVALADLIEEITNVSKDILLDRKNLSLASVAQKMSWASLRRTTRVEDEAYSLIGLFGVNMPTIYGEGRRAFIRLQQELIRISHDHSIFAWDGDGEFSGMLATSPSQFANSAGHAPMEYSDFADHFDIKMKEVFPTGVHGVRIPFGGQKPDYTMTNFGLHIQLPLVSMSRHFNDFYFAFLACTHGADKEATAIFLRRRPGRPKGHFYRTLFNDRALHHAPGPSSITKAITTEIIWVSGNELQTRPPDIGSMVKAPSRPLRYDFCTKAHRGLDGSAVKIVDVYPPNLVIVSGDGVQADASFVTGSHAVVIFQHETSGHKMAFIFGAHNWSMWFNFHYSTAVGTAKEDHKAYDIFERLGFWHSLSYVIKFANDLEKWMEYSSTTVGDFALELSQCDGGEGTGNDAVERFVLDVIYVPQPQEKDVAAELDLFCLPALPRHSFSTMALSTPLKNQEYTIGWICVLPLELAAACAMLDESHGAPQEQHPQDKNNYYLGSIWGFNIAIACPPFGVCGATSAATVATQMLSSFQSIRIGLMVGIGGGIPSKIHDIRLGDIVVSKPKSTFGVVQYDFGKVGAEGKFIRTGSLNKPPLVLLNAIARLQAEHMLKESNIPRYLSEMLAKYTSAKVRADYSYQGAQNDRLYEADYKHVGDGDTCEYCDVNKVLPRLDRNSNDPFIHYGAIASGNKVIKHGETRDQVGKEFGVICFEMEAAGLMDNYPCLVIRGICDYSDSHKNKRWRRYAAVTAAAYAKELLSMIPPNRVDILPTVAEVIQAG